MIWLKGIPRFEPRTAHHNDAIKLEYLMHNINTSDLFIFYLDLNMWQIMAKLCEKWTCHGMTMSKPM